MLLQGQSYSAQQWEERPPPFTPAPPTSEHVSHFPVHPSAPIQVDLTQRVATELPPALPSAPPLQSLTDSSQEQPKLLNVPTLEDSTTQPYAPGESTTRL